MLNKDWKTQSNFKHWYYCVSNSAKQGMFYHLLYEFHFKTCPSSQTVQTDP